MEQELKLKIGDSIVVKPDIKDPDTGLNIGGWQGRVVEIDKEEGLIYVEWDTITLKNMPYLVIEKAEAEGWIWWDQFSLKPSEVEITMPRDSQDEVAMMIAELEAKTSKQMGLAKSKISTPAIILIGVSALSIIFLLGSLTFSSWLILSGTAGTMEQPIGMTKETQLAIRMTWTVLMLISSIIILFGAFRMKNLNNRTLATVACILAIIPCLGPCFILGIPFGIWGLLVLRDEEVQVAFENSENVKIVKQKEQEST